MIKLAYRKLSFCYTFFFLLKFLKAVVSFRRQKNSEAAEKIINEVIKVNAIKWRYIISYFSVLAKKRRNYEFKKTYQTKILRFGKQVLFFYI